jgi:nicotinate-nucleotide adenylyltransferase
MHAGEQMRKIGILGGTFNPIHNGHIEIALRALNALALDEIILIPSGHSYMKKDEMVAEAGHRLKMTKLAVAELAQISVSDIEIRRPGNSYTCETIAELKEMYPEGKFYFIIGADTLYNMEKWKNPEYVLGNVVIVAAVRDNKTINELKQQSEYLTAKYAAVIHLLPGEKIAISSRMIREYLKNDAPIDNLVPAEVEEYITRNNLYETC